MRSSKKEVSEKQLLGQVVERLDKVILAIALQGRPKEEQIKYPTSLGHSNSEMANVLATLKIEVRSILLALSFLVKKAEKGRVFTLCLLVKEFFV